MYFRKSVSIFITSILISLRLHAEEPASNEAIQKQLLEMQKSIQEIQTRHQAEIDTLKKQIDEQQALIAALKPPAPDNTPVLPDPPAAFPTSDPALVPSAMPPAGELFPTTDPSVVANSPAAAPTPGLIPAPGLIGGSGGASKGSYLNISFDSVFVGAASSADDLSKLEVGDHDPPAERLQRPQRGARSRRRGGSVFARGRPISYSTR